MASCDMQETPSQEELKKNEIIKNVKNSVEDPTTSSGSELQQSASSVTKLTKVTKIPGPVLRQSSSRLYSSVVRLSKQPSSFEDQQVADDSGIHMDSSMTELEAPLSVRPSPILQAILERIPGSSNELELQQAEEQTLKELQRVVAEMEAEVALDDLDMQELQSAVESEPLGQNEAQEDSDLYTSQLSANETCQKPLPSDPKLEPSNEKLTEDHLQMQKEESVDEKESAEKKKDAEKEETTEKQEFVEACDAFDQLAQEPTQEHPQFVPEETAQESGDREQKSVPDSLLEELEMAITEEERFFREELERSREMLGQKFQRPADEILSTTSEEGLGVRPSLASSQSDRRMVPLEELLDAEHNVELLRQLLQTGAEEATTEEQKETKAAAETETETETETDSDQNPAQKETNKLPSFLRRLMSSKILQFSYPILFCSVAFSLIYLSRKE
ncbi:uncharacterized protein LOC108150710 isoform X2 [Drosophila elegans]|uniref:uncharacterized protein LOC108150710 isoform X2 n=1 Tax=Drosophila elegans TaxID=30023 RepID=UPI0007E7D442|nr:uncharacterized protein LOC108150710 isoform X2 [Drosophila elegans]XP_017134476.1 uncharacterized protein LOC108150710 isoform X2 [Drosophila elegans]